MNILAALEKQIPDILSDKAVFSKALKKPV